MAMFGGMNLLSGAPMFQVRPQAGFVGGMNPAQQQSAQDYFDRVAAMQAEERARNDARRSDRLDRQFQNREMSLKELLGNSSIQDAAEQRQIARDRLGLDANTAASDADLRRNALSLQERLGLMSEDRMSNSDAAQNALAMQKFENDKFNQDRSFTQLSKEQQTNRDLAIQQLEQQRQRDMNPYLFQTKDQEAQTNYQNKALAQNADQYNRPSGNTVAGEQGATLRTLLQNQLAQQLHDNPSGNAILSETGTNRRADEANKLARDLNAAVSGNTAATLAQQNDHFGRLSAAQAGAFNQQELDRNQSKQQFGDNLEQRKTEFNQGQQNWRNEFNNKQAIQESENNYRKDHLKTIEQGNLMHMLGPYMEAIIGSDPETRDRAIGAMRQMLPASNMPAMTPSERASKTLFNNQIVEAQKSAAPQVKTIQDVSKQNAAAARTLFDQHVNQKRPLNEVLKAAAESDQNSPQGAASTTQTLQQLLDARDAENKRLMIRGQQMMQPSGPGNIYIPRHSPFMR